MGYLGVLGITGGQHINLLDSGQLWALEYTFQKTASACSCCILIGWLQERLSNLSKAYDKAGDLN